jgi:hypothetical protein
VEGKIAGRSPVLWWYERRLDMLQPESHLDVVRDRHSDLLRQARAGELAAELGAARAEERRSFLARLRARRQERPASQPATSQPDPA